MKAQNIQVKKAGRWMYFAVFEQFGLHP